MILGHRNSLRAKENFTDYELIKLISQRKLILKWLARLHYLCIYILIRDIQTMLSQMY